MRLEIVTHCWRFSRALTYQLSSLLLHPPKKVRPTITVFFSDDDAPTVRLLNHFSFQVMLHDEFLALREWSLPKPELCRRAIGRDLICREPDVDADLFWFCDADYIFGEGCLDALADVDLSTAQMFYPRVILQTPSREAGDQYCLRVADGPVVADIKPKHFSQAHKIRTAIGGLQIMRGDAAREVGYCRDTPWQTPSSKGNWKQTHEDKAIRKILVDRYGPECIKPIELPNLFRLRQAHQGVCDELVAPVSPGTTA